MQLRARIGITLLALAVAGALAYGFLPRPIPVDVAAVETAPLAVTVEEEGKTRVMDRYVISAPMAGYARRIDLHVGDAVAAGQVLAVIEPSRADALDPRTRSQAQAQANAAAARLAAARENTREAQAQAQLAQQELARAESLGQASFLSKQAIDRARANDERARAVLAAAEHSVSVARFELDTALAALAKSSSLQAGAPAELMPLRSPVRAQVLKVAHESEGAVQVGQPLIEIGNPESLEVEVEVLSTQAVKIGPGTPVLLDRWGGEQTLEGRVRVVEPAGYTKVSALGVEEQRVRVIIDFTSPREAWRRLGDGYRVEARFVVWQKDDVLQLPANALFRHNNGLGVYVVEKGRARLRAVQIGQRTGLRAEVLSGLKAGERVITHPDDKISDGRRVKPRQA